MEIFKTIQNTLGGQKSDNKRYKIKINENGTSSANEKINQQIKEHNLWMSDLDKFYKERDGDSYVTSTCTGNKKALFVGINYYGTSAQLSGCINDIKNVSELVCARYGFKNCLYLTDENPDPLMKPTYNNIINGMKWLVRGAKSGDSLFFHYSGHGGTSKDTDSDEIDGFDETKGSENCDDVKDICPFGYGVRADGKILPGARADKWIKKELQKGKNEENEEKESEENESGE